MGIYPSGSSNNEQNSVFKIIDGEEFQDRYDLHKLVAGIPRHILTILGTTLLFTLLGILATWYYLGNYKAESIVVFQLDETKTLPGGIPLTNINLATAVDMVTIPVNMQGLKSMLGIDLSVKDIQEKIDVSPPRLNSNLIKITAYQSNPNLAIDMANTLARISVKASQDYYKDQLKVALYNYRDQLETTNQALAKQMQEIEDFKTTHHYFEMDDKSSVLLSRLVDQRRKLQDADLQYSGLLVEYENLKREVERLGEMQLSAGIGDPTSRMRLNALETALVEARMKYSKENPKLKSLENELKELRQGTGGAPLDGDSLDSASENLTIRDRMQVELMRLQGKVRSAQKMKEDLTSSMTTLEKQLETLPAEQVSFNRLLQNKRILEEQVQFLNNSIDLTQLLLNTPRGSLGLYQLADKAYSLKESWWVKVLPLIAGIFGFLTGLALAFIKEMREGFLRTQKQVDMNYSIPFLGVIPEISNLTKENAQEKTLFYIRDIVEKIDKKEASLGYPQNHPLTLTVISPITGDGKTLIAYHLSLYYQRLGRKVLLMEFDPNGQSYTSDAPSGTISDYLRGKKEYKEIVHQGKPDNIRIGSDDPEMKELLRTQRMNDLWNRAKQDYQVVIIDAPGVIEEGYAANLAALTDLYVLVVGSSKSDKERVDTALRQLEFLHARPAGILLNEVPHVYIFDQRVIGEMDKQPNRFLNKLLFWK